MSLSFVLILGTVQWYQILKKMVILQREKRQDLSVGRLAFQFFMRDLKNSGYRGCRTFDHNFPVRRFFVQLASPARFLKIDRKVFGFNATPGNCYGKMPEEICKKIKQDSTVLMIYSVPQTIYGLTQDMRSSDEALYIRGGHDIHRGSIVLISDCQQGDLFIAEEVDVERIFHRKTVQANLTERFSKCYKKGTEITEVKMLAYYLGTPARLGKSSGGYSLYRDDLFHRAEEVLENIVDFQVEFGVLEPSGVFQYKSVTSIKADQWQDVQTVRLKVQAKSVLEKDPKQDPQKSHANFVNAGYQNKEWEYEISLYPS
jgi:hypothetical protein